MRIFRDQMNCDVAVHSAQRIVSLVPSQTELLFDLGLEDRIVGVTKFCVHPERAKQKTIVGGTKNFHLDTIDQLQPDLIIGNKEENYPEGIELLKQKYSVWMSDIFQLSDAHQMITSLAEITNTTSAGEVIINSIHEEFKSLQKYPARKVLYLIWKNPWMTAGTNTFIDFMIRQTGLINVVAAPRYPQLTSEEIKHLSPELIFLSSEPYPFQEKHKAELSALVPKAKVVLVDGEMFSWYGSRLMKAPAYLNRLRCQLD